MALKKRKKDLTYSKKTFFNIFFPIGWDILLMIFGGFLAVIITDAIKRPRLKVTAFLSRGHSYGEKKSVSYLSAEISNKKFNLWGIKIEKEAAVDCKVSLQTARGNSTFNYQLLWEEDSWLFERKINIYSGQPQRLRLFGKIQGESEYFVYYKENVSEISHEAKFLDTEREFILTIQDGRGNKVSKKITVDNSSLNNLKITY